MVIGTKAVAASVSAVGLVTLMSGMVVHYRSARSNDLPNVMASGAGAVPGRIVSVPVKTYREAFKSTLSLGQCPLVKDENGGIKTCTAEFEGTSVLIAKGSMTVDVSRVESSEDIMTHIMGGFGASVGVLGLVSVGVKYNVAVTTETTKKNLNLLSSYELHKGVLAIQSPKPKTIITDAALYLSEIELGGNEFFLVTLEFNSEKQKIDIQVTITFKILFISISAKLKFVIESFTSDAKARIQFKSSWRKEYDEIYDDLKVALPRVKELEDEYMKGPQLLRDMSSEDENAHSFYYFSSWKQTPYGQDFNHALINHDLDFLTDQNTEMKAVLERIKALSKKRWSDGQRGLMNELNQTMTENTDKLTKGLDTYHTLTPTARQALRDLYGEDKAPLYYTRKLNAIIGE